MNSIAVRIGGAPTGLARPQGWSGDLDRVMNQAIRQYNLENLGWRGFEALPWVKQIKQKYPAIEKIASTCSGHQGPHLEATRDLFSSAKSGDRPTIQNYFIGKLGLEELSCRRAGAMGGMCDKKAAYIVIWDLSKQWVPPER